MESVLLSTPCYGVAGNWAQAGAPDLPAGSSHPLLGLAQNIICFLFTAPKGVCRGGMCLPEKEDILAMNNIPDTALDVLRGRW